MAAASLAVLVLLTDAAQTLHPVASWAYGTARIAWELLIDLAVAWGTWRAWRSRRGAAMADASAAA